MYQFFKLVVVILIILYPVSIYFGLQYFSPSQLGLFLLAVFVLRILVIRKHPAQRGKQLLLTVFIGVILASLTWIFDTEKFLLWYPVGLNSVMLIVFIASLLFPPSAIEVIARIREPELNTEGVAYTRKVTMVWSVFFAINALVSTWTVLNNDMRVWTLYNGLLAYLAMGVLFVGELILRQRVRRKQG